MGPSPEALLIEAGNEDAKLRNPARAIADMKAPSA
jgi:hypothetical protein